jgi:hypothetical protein
MRTCVCSACLRVYVSLVPAGPLPAELARLPSLAFLDLSHNQLTGSLDSFGAALTGSNNLLQVSRVGSSPSILCIVHILCIENKNGSHGLQQPAAGGLGGQQASGYALHCCRHTCSTYRPPPAAE